jgi:hypothetical protein
VSKPATAEELNAAAWAAALASPVVADKVPAGWFTSKQIGKQLNKADSTMGALLSRAVGEGRAERKSFRVTIGSVTRPVPHYRLK